MNGVREFVIMRQTGQKTIATRRRYIRSDEIFRENAAALESEHAARAREESLPGLGRASCQAEDLQPFIKMVASVLAGSDETTDFCAALDWHTLGKCPHESLLRLPLFCRETLINTNQWPVRRRLHNWAPCDTCHHP
jgi:hypothetical protein